MLILLFVLYTAVLAGGVVLLLSRLGSEHTRMIPQQDINTAGSLPISNAAAAQALAAATLLHRR